jgi:hypothetical protein
VEGRGLPSGIEVRPLLRSMAPLVFSRAWWSGSFHGSRVLGADDALSRDHGWGPMFSLHSSTLKQFGPCYPPRGLCTFPSRPGTSARVRGSRSIRCTIDAASARGMKPVKRIFAYDGIRSNRGYKTMNKYNSLRFGSTDLLMGRAKP